MKIAGYEIFIAVNISKEGFPLKAYALPLVTCDLFWLTHPPVGRGHAIFLNNNRFVFTGLKSITQSYYNYYTVPLFIRLKQKT